MKKNGFTLIELLAVIIILAIIALIATPIVLNVVDDAKKSAATSEANLIVSSIQNGCSVKDMKSQMEGSTETPCVAAGETTKVFATESDTLFKSLVNTQATVKDLTVDKDSKVISGEITSKGYTFTVTDGKVAEKPAA